MKVTLSQLEALLPPESAYPLREVRPIRPRLPGRSFFPGGCGLAFGGGQPYPARPIMVVGQDFDSSDDWDRLDDAAMQQAEAGSATWRGLGSLGASGLLDLEQAFFTNCLLGCRVAASNTGVSPAIENAGYVDASLACLEAQIRLLRPSVVVALGTLPTCLLARRFGLAPLAWRPAVPPTWREIDKAGLQFVEQVAGVIDGACAFASCTHPCYPGNARYRRWHTHGREHVGKEAQALIWRAVRRHHEQAALGLSRSR